MSRVQWQNTVDVQLKRMPRRYVHFGYSKTPRAPVWMVGWQLQRILGQKIRRGATIATWYTAFKAKGVCNTSSHT